METFIMSISYLLSYKLDILAFDVIPEFCAYCFTICHLLSVCQLPSLVERGQLTLRYRWQLPPCFNLLMMHNHAWYKCPQTP